MSIFGYAFNQKAILRRKKDIGFSGGVQYGEPEEIRCRFDYKRSETIGADGNKAASNASIFTDAEIQPLDLIDYDGRTWTVSSVTAVRNLHGKIDHWEAVL